MDSQLILALQERIAAEYTKDQIKAEMLALGYDEAAFEAAYQAAVQPAVTTPIPVPGAPTQLPSYLELAKSAFTLAKDHVLLVLKTIVAFVLICLTTAFVVQSLALMLTSRLESGLGYTPEVLMLGSVIAFAILAAVLASISVFAAILRVLLSRSQLPRYRDGVWFAAKNIVAISLVSLYVNILTQVGYMLLIIPGVLLSIYLLFSMFALLSGKEKGIAALASSTALVYGRFFPVLGRILFSIALILVAILGFILVAAGSTFLPSPFEALSVMAIVLATIFISFWQLCFTVVLYESLSVLPPAKPLPVSFEVLKKIYRYIVVAVIVVLLFISSFLGLGGVLALQNGYFTGEWSETTLKSDVRQKQLVFASIKNAATFYESNGSYTYACAELALPENITCTESEMSIALEVEVADGFYCVDSEGYNEVTKRTAIADGGVCGGE